MSYTEQGDAQVEERTIARSKATSPLQGVLASLTEALGALESSTFDLGERLGPVFVDRSEPMADKRIDQVAPARSEVVMMLAGAVERVQILDQRVQNMLAGLDV